MSAASPSLHDLITDYYATKPNFTQHIKDVEIPIPTSKDSTPKTQAQPSVLASAPKSKGKEKEKDKDKDEWKELDDRLKELELLDTPEKRAEQIKGVWPDRDTRRDIENKRQHPLSTILKMPVMPTEEKKNEGGAKDTSNNPSSMASAMAHKAAPGPVMAQAEDIGKPASKEELKKRAEELNKD